jgi:hypothetical protein
MLIIPEIIENERTLSPMFPSLFREFKLSEIFRNAIFKMRKESRSRKFFK